MTRILLLMKIQHDEGIGSKCRFSTRSNFMIIICVCIYINRVGMIEVLVLVRWIHDSSFPTTTFFISPEISFSVVVVVVVVSIGACVRA